jgi:RNA polymerase sigma-70 factor (ECF subfamily)
LPRRIAQVFMLREVMGFSIEEICKDMQITTSNCSVILYRARLRLRNCLEKKWFRK